MARDKVVRVDREEVDFDDSTYRLVGFAIISEGREFFFLTLAEAVEAMREAQANRKTYAACFDAEAREEAGIHEGELRAEFAMSWVMGGGAQEDIDAAWHQIGWR